MSQKKAIDDHLTVLRAMPLERWVTMDDIQNRIACEVGIDVFKSTEALCNVGAVIYEVAKGHPMFKRVRISDREKDPMRRVFKAGLVTTEYEEALKAKWVALAKKEGKKPTTRIDNQKSYEHVGAAESTTLRTLRFIIEKGGSATSIEMRAHFQMDHRQFGALVSSACKYKFVDRSGSRPTTYTINEIGLRYLRKKGQK